MTASLGKIGFRTRFMAVLAITALLALAMVQVTSAAASSNNNGGGTPGISDAIDALASQLSAFEATTASRFDTIDATLLAIQGQIGTETDEIDGTLLAIQGQIGTETDEIDATLAALSTLVSTETGEIDTTFSGFLTAFEDVYGWVDSVANPDPFTTTVTTCAEYGGSGELGIEFTAEVVAELAAHAGVNIFGTGITADIKPTGTAAGKLEFLGFGQIFQEVCYAGVEVAGDPDARTPSQQQAILDYTQTAYDFQGQGGGASGAAYYPGSNLGPVFQVSYVPGINGTTVSSHGGFSVLDLASDIGASVSGMGDALGVLVSVETAAANPAALFADGESGFDDFIDSMGVGSLFEPAELLGALDAPCDIFASFGGDAATACAATESALGGTIDEIDAALTLLGADLTEFSGDVESWFTTLGGDIDAGFAEVGGWITQSATTIIDGVTAVLDWLGDAIQTIIDAINSLDVGGAIGDAFGGAGGGSGGSDPIGDFFCGIFGC